MHGDLLAGSVGHLELRRSFTLKVVPVALQQVDEIPVLELGERRQLLDSLEPNQFDVTVCCLSRLVEQIRISIEQRFQVRLRFFFGRTLSCRAHLRRERNPALVVGALSRDRYVHVFLRPLRSVRAQGYSHDREHNDLGEERDGLFSAEIDVRRRRVSVDQ